MKLKETFLIGLFALALASCNNNATTKPSASKADAATAIYFGGDIITMEGDSPAYAEAVAIKDGKIVFVGSKSDAEKMKGDSTTMNDLQGKTLLPGFIDSWSHIGFVTFTADFTDLSFWSADAPSDFNSIIKKMKATQQQQGIKPGEWVVGIGYDPTYLKENRHPTSADIDAAFPDNPVVLIHLSGIMAVANTAGLKLLGISSKTKDPPGGTIVRIPGTQEPEGMLQGNSFLSILPSILGKPTMEQLRQRLQKALQVYAANGFTTIQDGVSAPPIMALFKEAGEKNELMLDIVALPPSDLADALISGEKAVTFGVYKNHFKVGGIVVSGDSGPQERTALFTKPFLTRVPGKDANYRGLALNTQEEMNRIAKLCYKNNIQYYCYSNGDGGIDMQLEAIAKAVKELNDTNQNRRTVITHSQFVRKDQLDIYKKYGIIPSFFTNHTYMFGDVHVQNLGKERAYFLSPMKTAADKGLVVTNHTDYASAPPGGVFAAWTAVNRISRTDVIIGPDERVTPYAALKAMTLNGAYMYFEENTKGSIKEGKLADLIILDQNPLKTDPMKLKDIVVLETIKEGKSVYKK